MRTFKAGDVVMIGEQVDVSSHRWPLGRVGVVTYTDDKLPYPIALQVALRENAWEKLYCPSELHYVGRL